MNCALSYSRHRDARLAASKRYAATHRQARLRYRASRREAHREQMRRWRAAHRDACRAYDRAHYDADAQRRGFRTRGDYYLAQLKKNGYHGWMDYLDAKARAAGFASYAERRKAWRPKSVRSTPIATPEASL